MKYLIIENNPEKAVFYENAGVDTIFIDLEILGKKDRQGHIDSVKSNHSVKDIIEVKKNLSKAELLVRIDPINKDSIDQIEAVIDAGADTIMLPYFKKTQEVEKFLKAVNGRVNAVLLLETSSALVHLEQILELDGIDGIHIGLNDLSLSLEIDFMFQIVPTQFLESIVKQIDEKNIPFGIGGVAPVGDGLIPGQMVLMEYIRLGASSTILSRPFSKLTNYSESEFIKSFDKLKMSEQEIYKSDILSFKNNKMDFKKILKDNF